MDKMKLGGVALLGLALCFSCQKSDDDQPAAMNTAGTTAAGSGGSSSSGGSVGAEGGDGTAERYGERGSSCNSTADCADGLTCIVTNACPAGVACANKTCQPSNFDLTGTGKRCHISECTAKKDCCGDKPLQAPAKCANRENICSKPTLPGCTTGLTCVQGSTTCGEGTCTGKCTYDAKACTVAADCPANTCDPVTQLCALTQVDCSATACTTYSNVCQSTCVCTNPDYNPSASICTDPDCEDICGFTCRDDRCVVDDSCLSDTECAATTPFCVSGACVECKKDADCDDEKCVNGHCGPRCKADTQCGLFEACQGGECVHVGCRTDRECVLQARAQNAASAQDPRLAKCEVENGVGKCVMPCDIDAQCEPTEVCLEGTCKYIGCETDAECKTIAGLHDLPVSTPERPWVTTAVCKAEDTATP